MKEFPLELVYRLYKAEIGDVIDNTYVRLTGAWKTNDDRQLRSNGFLERSDIYEFVFKDLTDGAFYRASNAASRANDPNRPNNTCLYEPFTRNTIDPFPVFQCEYEASAINPITMIEDVWG